MKELESQRENANEWAIATSVGFVFWLIQMVVYTKIRDGIQRTYGYLDFIHFTNSDVHLWRFALPGGNQKNVSWNRCTV